MERVNRYFFASRYLSLSAPERFIFRLVAYISYAVLGSSAVIFIISQKQALNALAIIIALFLIDRVFVLGRARTSLTKVLYKSNVEVVEKGKAGKNIEQFLNPKAVKLLESAQTRTLLLGGDLHLHLFLLLLRQTRIQKAFARLEIDSEKIISKAEDHLNKSKKYKPSQREILVAIKTVVEKAFLRSLKHYDKDISPNDLMAALGLIQNTSISKIYTLFNIEGKDLENALVLSRKNTKRKKTFFSRTHRVREKRMNRAWTARPTPNLDRFSIDITDLVRSGEAGFLIGHAKVYDRLVDLLSRDENPNALLIGEPGTGKDSIIHHLGFQIIKDRVPKPLFDKRLVSLEVGALASGANEGQLEERITAVINEIELAGNIILYIPEIHELVKTAGPMRLSGADVLLPRLKTASFSVVGSTYPSEYAKYIEENSNFKSTFDPIRVEEISKEEAVRYLSYQSLVLEHNSPITISLSAVRKAVDLAHKYFQHIKLPASAESLLKESVADAIEKGQKLITASDLIDIAEKRINVPIRASSKEEGEKLLNLEQEIHKNYVNQDEAVKAVSQALRQYRSGLSKANGPIASFLFVGPTGVGKTELSKILALIQFGSRKAMKRFDMSEYQNSESISKLIGSADGNVHGSLTGSIRKEPYSLILLDEFEKAHPDLLNLFLQVLDDARLTDSIGRTVDFSNTIIIATSNAHSTLIKEEIEKGATMLSLTEIIKKRLTEYFKPELINRFSKIIVFKSLSWQDTLAITKLNVQKVVKDLEGERGVRLEISESAIQAITSLGFDEVYGARPLNAVISEKIKNLLADKILRQEIERGQTWQLIYQNENFNLQKIGEN